MNTPSNEGIIKERTPERLRRERHGATDRGNAQRLRSFVTIYGANMPDHHLGAVLPSLIRMEAEAATLAATYIGNFKADDTAVIWKYLIERARTLNEWAEACAFPSRQGDAVDLFRMPTA